LMKMVGWCKMSETYYFCKKCKNKCSQMACVCDDGRYEDIVERVVNE